MKPSPLVALLGLCVTLLSVALHDLSSASEPSVKTAIFAGGCFWCMEEAFEGVSGVQSVVSGYSGGTRANPTYEQVSAGTTGHAEVVQVSFDPTIVDYSALLEVFWRNVDPTTADRQFCDKGLQYRPAIFYADDRQKLLAEASMKHIEETKSFPEALKVQIAPATTFYPAEEYHQDFYKRNPIRYKFYKFNCGRARRLAELWEAAGG